MDRVLTQLITLTKQFRVFLKHRVSLQDRKAQDYVSEYQALISEFVGLAKKHPKDMHEIFIDHNIIHIQRIYDTLVGEYAHTYIDNTIIDGTFRHMIDKLTGSLGVQRPNARFARVPTKILGDFLKGITYFKADDPVGRPIYHRSRSCESKDHTVLDKFRICQADTTDAIKQKRSALDLCYIERTAYDKIYEYVFHRQDTGHHVELNRVERLWQEYFPGQRLEIDIAYDEYGLPNALAIYRNKGKLSVHELYVKEDDSVHCERSVYRLRARWSPFLVSKQTKEQSFVSQAPWPVTPHTSINEDVT